VEITISEDMLRGALTGCIFFAVIICVAFIFELIKIYGFNRRK